MDYQIPSKANRVLNLIFLALVLILIRVWYLAVLHHDDYVEQAKKPQRRTVSLHPERGTLRDRFNIPLALNKLQYNASVSYAQLKQIPTRTWKKNAEGKKIRVEARKEYIEKLSHLLSRELGVDALYVEDLIHGKASFFPSLPFVIKEDISEAQYYRLKMLEKEWLGIHAERVSKRIYPKGKVAGDIIGYLGAISQKEYYQIANEMKELQRYISEREAGEFTCLPKGFHSPLEVRERLRQIEEKAYTSSTLLGKTGIEAMFDENLRGVFGKKIYEVDRKGNYLRELPGSRPPVNGQRLFLTISAELQEYAEALLAQNETWEETHYKRSVPWMKGGAIVAMLPQTGEIVALASYPRLDPKDFIPSSDPKIKEQKNSSIVKWLETESHIGEIWDGKKNLEKECYSFQKQEFFEKNEHLTWEKFLTTALGKESPARLAMKKISTIHDAYLVQNELTKLAELSGTSDAPLLIHLLYSDSKQHKPSYKPTSEKMQEVRAKWKERPDELAEIKNALHPFLSSLPHNLDKLLVIDLCRLLFLAENFSSDLLEKTGNENVSTLRTLCQEKAALESYLKSTLRKWHYKLFFATWRKDHFKDFLSQKRKEEKEKGLYAKPYTDYLESAERRFFKNFWEGQKEPFLEALLSSDLSLALQKHPSLIPYAPFLNSEELRKNPHVQKLKEYFSRFDSETLPEIILALLKTMRSFEQLESSPLLGAYPNVRGKVGQQTQKHLACSFYPLYGFGYGRSYAFRQAIPQGSIFKIVSAYEGLRQRYLELRENHDSLSALNPLTLIDDLKALDPKTPSTQILGYHLNGLPIYRSYKNGILPRSSHPLIGKIDILGAIEQSSNLYFSVLAGDHMSDPTDLSEAARAFGFGELSGIELPGEFKGNIPSDVSHDKTGLYSFAIGQHSLIVTPLQSAVMLASIANGGKVLKPKIIKLMAGKEFSHEHEDVFTKLSFPFQADLSLVGLTFPLFTESVEAEQKAALYTPPVTVKRSLNLPSSVRATILEGMRQAVVGVKGSARASIMRRLYDHPSSVRDYYDLHNQIVGKTGTAELLYKPTIDAYTAPIKENHTWFTALAFPEPLNESALNHTWPEPELVIVVYFPFGDAGRDAAPLATQVLKKWREIVKKHGGTSY